MEERNDYYEFRGEENNDWRAGKSSFIFHVIKKQTNKKKKRKREAVSEPLVPLYWTGTEQDDFNISALWLKNQSSTRRSILPCADCQLMEAESWVALFSA